MPNPNPSTSNNALPEPYIMEQHYKIAVETAFVGALINTSYSFTDEFRKNFDKSERDSLGNGVSHSQTSLRSTTLQNYNDIQGTNKSATGNIIHDNIDLVQIFFSYDSLAYKNYQLDRQALTSLPSSINIIQKTSMNLANTIKYFYDNVVIHELVYACQRGGELYFTEPATNPPTLTSRGSFTPAPDMTITDRSKRDLKYYSAITYLIDKFCRDNYVVNGTNVRSELNYPIDYFKIFIDSKQLTLMSQSLATQFGNKDFGINNSEPFVFTTPDRRMVKVIPNLKKAINTGLKDVITNLQSREAIPFIDDTFNPILIIVPANEIGTDIWYQDKPQVALTTLGLQEKQIFTSFKFLAKSIGSIYTNTSTTTKYVEPTIIANSNLIGIWSQSDMPAGFQNSTYDNFKEILKDDEIAKTKKSKK